MFQCRPGPPACADGRSRLIDESVVETVLGRALKTGGDFAEIYAEDRRATRAGLDDGGGGGPGFGRGGGGGIPGGGGGTTRFAPTSEPTERGPPAAPEGGRRRGR